MKITKLDHVQLAMPAGREEDARRFYETTLGLPEISKPEPLASRGGCWFGTERVQIHLGVEAEFKPALKAHPAFAVDDIEAIASKLESAGFQVKWDDSVDSVKRFFTADSFGNRIEILRDGDSFL